MKKFKSYSIICFLFLSVCASAQITINSTGKVGINNSSPTYNLDLDGNFNLEQTGTSRIVTQNGKRILFNNSDMYTDNSANLGIYGYSTMWNYLYSEYATFTYNPTILSDKNTKKEIKDLDKTLSKLVSLRPVKYRMKAEKANKETSVTSESETPAEKKLQVGLIAQEVQNIFPEVVTQVGDSHLGIRYTELVPMLIKALQEQQEKISMLREKAEYYVQNSFNNEILKGCKVYQSKLNTGNKSITFEYEIPASVKSAELYICNTKGKLLKRNTIDSHGSGSILIDVNEFENEKLFYCFVQDGLIVDTKQFLLTN